MKKLLFLSTIMMLLSSVTISQTYLEIKENGWGFAMQMCKPALADLNQNGLVDMLVGTRQGNIIHFEQVSAGPDSFVLISETFNDIKIGQRTAPCFTDLDQDGLIDLLIGSDYRNIQHYEQDSAGSLLFTLQDENFITDESTSRLVPTITDFENDGILDLVVGAGAFLRYFKQDSVGATTFSLISSKFTATDFSSESAPVFTDFNHDGLLDLLVGSNNGKFYHFQQNAAGDTAFTLVTDYFNNIQLGYISAACFFDLDQDDLLDMITGNSHGKLGFYEQDSVNSTTFSLMDGDLINNIDVDWCAAPAIIDLDGDNLLDVCIGMDKAKIYHYEQETFGSTNLLLLTEKWNDWDIGNFAKPVFTNLDSDNLIDLIIGEMSNRLFYFEQDAVGSTTFSQISDNLNELTVEQYPSPCFSDIDNDGLLDLLVGNGEGTLQHFEQESLNDTTFIQKSFALNGIDVGAYAVPTMTDLDNDGLLDLVIGCVYGNLYHYEQQAANDTVFALVTENFANVQVVNVSIPTFADLNGDGLEDLIVGDGDGGVHYFQRTNEIGIIENQRNSISFKLFPNYPNPFNPVTTINYDLSKSARVNISIYNLLGQNIKVIENKFQQTGSYSVQWDGKDEHGISLTSGVYICRLQAEEFSQSIKIMLVK